MPRYFFHVYHDESQIDHEGEELPDKHAAWQEATVMAGQTLQSLDGKLKPGRDWRMEVTDEFANPCTSCTFRLRGLSKTLSVGGLGHFVYYPASDEDAYRIS